MKFFTVIITFLLLTTGLTNAGDCYGQRVVRKETFQRDSTEAIVFHFRFSRSMLDSAYMSNKASLAELKRIMADEEIVSTLDSIVIVASASPEGNVDYNIRLAADRAKAVRGYISWKYPQVDRDKVFACSIGEDWNGLYRMVEADPKVPYKERVLATINQDVNLATKEWRLRQIGGGVAWKYIEQHFLRYLRSGATSVIFYRRLVEEEIIPEEPVVVEVIEEQKIVEELPPAIRQRQFGVNINILPFTVPNLGFEYFFNEKFSLRLHLAYAFFYADNFSYREKLWYASPEFRYHLNHKKNDIWGLGHYLSLYGNVSNFNLMWKCEGKQGWLYGGGIGYGYNLYLGKGWVIDFNIGVGALYLDYDNYRHWPNEAHVQDNEFLNRKQTLYFGPTKLGVDFQYRF